MNIALLPSAFHPSLGGVEELTRQLAHAFRRQGHGVVLITNRWPRDLPEHEIFEGLDLYRLPMRFPGESIKSWTTYVSTRSMIRRRLASILRRHACEVLHVQCVSTQAAYAVWAKRKLGLPLIVTLQGELTMDATRLYQRSRRAQALMRTALTEADVVTACSRQTLEEAAAFMGGPWRQPARVIYNGVRVEELSTAAPYVHSRPYVLAIGRHVPQKGFDVLLQAYGQYVRAGGSLDLILAGDGPETSALKQLVAELGLEGRAHLVGRADRAMAASLFRGCAFFVLPSRHEPFGIVNVEAMAAGKAVIATRVGGVPEIVEDGVNGLLVPPEDEAALSSAIQRFTEDAAAREAMAAKGRARVTRFEWSSIAAEYVEAFCPGF